MIKVFGCYRNSNVVRKKSVFSIKQIISNLENITQHEDKKKSVQCGRLTGEASQLLCSAPAGVLRDQGYAIH